jgi:hypothetical protein
MEDPLAACERRHQRAAVKDVSFEQAQVRRGPDQLRREGVLGIT